MSDSLQEHILKLTYYLIRANMLSRFRDIFFLFPNFYVDTIYMNVYWCIFNALTADMNMEIINVILLSPFSSPRRFPTESKKETQFQSSLQ